MKLRLDLEISFLGHKHLERVSPDSGRLYFLKDYIKNNYIINDS